MGQVTSDRLLRGLLWTAPALVVIAFIGNDLLYGDSRVHLDLLVYLTALNEWRAGGSLYDAGVDIGDTVLPFTYPPFAAILLAPLSFLPPMVAQALWSGVNLLLLAVVVRQVVLPQLPTSFAKAWHRDAWLVGSWLVLVFSGPVAETLQLGQVSLLVWVLVILDLTVVPRRFRGVLTGIAGGIKLFPLIFLGYYVVTRQWRAGVIAVGAFLATVAVGFLVLPTDSMRYWTVELFRTDRVGDLASQHNKSLLGLLSHWGLAGPGRVVWLILAVVIVAIGLWRVARLHRRGEQIGAILVAGLLTPVVAPITWMHHLIWFPLASLYLVIFGGRWRWIGVAILVAYNYFSPASIPLEGLPLWQQVAQGTMTLVLMAFAIFGLPLRRPSSAGAPDVG